MSIWIVIVIAIASFVLGFSQFMIAVCTIDSARMWFLDMAFDGELIDTPELSPEELEDFLEYVQQYENKKD